MTQTETGLKLEFTRTIRAKRERVFEAWIKPEVVERWFGPGSMMVPAAKIDARVGGAYKIDMRGSMSEGAPAQEMGVQGVYRRIVPNELLEFTWCGSWEPNETSLVTVLLKDVEGGTELTLRHEQFLTERSREGHEKGWLGGLANLQKTLES